VRKDDMNKVPRPAIFVLVVFAILVAGTTVLHSQETEEEAPTSSSTDPAVGRSWEKFRISFGGFIKRFDSRIRLDSEEHGIGTEIKLEDLGVSREDFNLRLVGKYRVGKKSDLTFGYYRWARASRHVLDEEIQWGDYIIEAGGRVDFDNDTHVAQVSYEYSVIKKKKWDLDLSAGLSLFSFDFRLEIEGEVTPIEEDGGNGIGGGTTQKTDLLAPVPALGLQLLYTFRPGLEAALRGHFFAFQADTWGGSMVDLALVVDWFPWKHVGLGAGLNSVRLNYDSDKKGELRVDYDYKGVLFFVTLVY